MKHLFQRHDFATVVLTSGTLAAGIGGWAWQMIAGTSFGSSLVAGGLFAGAAFIFLYGVLTLLTGGAGGGGRRSRYVAPRMESGGAGADRTYDTESIAQERSHQVMASAEHVIHEGAYRTRLREVGRDTGVNATLSPRDRSYVDGGDISGLNTKSVVKDHTGSFRPCFPVGLVGLSSADIADGTSPKPVVRDQLVFSSPDLPTGILLGPTGSGKSVGLVLNAVACFGVHLHNPLATIRDHVGNDLTPVGTAAVYRRKFPPAPHQHGFPMVVASPKPDVLKAAVAGRRQSGPVKVLSVDGHLPGVQVSLQERASWTPLAEVFDFESASRVGGSLARGVALGADNQFFESAASNMLTSSIFATFLVDYLRAIWVDSEARQSSHQSKSGVVSVLSLERIEEIIAASPDHEGIERLANLEKFECSLRTVFELIMFAPFHAPALISELLLECRKVLESVDDDLFNTPTERQQLISGTRSARSLIAEAAKENRGQDTTSSVIATVSTNARALAMGGVHPGTHRNIYDTLRSQSVSARWCISPVWVDKDGKHVSPGAVDKDGEKAVPTGQVPTLFLTAGSVTGATESRAISQAFLETLVRYCEEEAGKTPDQRITMGSLGLIIDEVPRMVASAKWLSEKCNTSRSIGVSMFLAFQLLWSQIIADMNGTAEDSINIVDACQPIICLSGGRHEDSLRRFEVAGGKAIREMTSQLSSSRSDGWSTGSSSSQSDRSNQQGSSGSTTESFSKSRELIANWDIARLSTMASGEGLALFEANRSVHFAAVPFFHSPFFSALLQGGPGSPGTEEWSVILKGDDTGQEEAY